MVVEKKASSSRKQEKSLVLLNREAVLSEMGRMGGALVRVIHEGVR